MKTASASNSLVLLVGLERLSYVFFVILYYVNVMGVVMV